MLSLIDKSYSQPSSEKSSYAANTGKCNRRMVVKDSDQKRMGWEIVTPHKTLIAAHLWC